MRLENKIALVTGGGQGIGNALMTDSLLLNQKSFLSFQLLLLKKLPFYNSSSPVYFLLQELSIFKLRHHTKKLCIGCMNSSTNSIVYTPTR